MDTVAISSKIIECFRNGNKLLICGNGGSACMSSHFAGELVGKFKKERQALPAIALNDAGMITAIGNDYGYEHVFERQVEAYGKKGDILVTLSTSGRSENVLLAVAKAKKLGLTVFSLPTNDEMPYGRLTGDPFRTGKSHLLPAETSTTQEYHLKQIHDICEMIEMAFV